MSVAVLMMLLIWCRPSRLLPSIIAAMTVTDLLILSLLESLFRFARSVFRFALFLLLLVGWFKLDLRDFYSGSSISGGLQLASVTLIRIH